MHVAYYANVCTLRLGVIGPDVQILCSHADLCWHVVPPRKMWDSLLRRVSTNPLCMLARSSILSTRSR